MLFFELKYLLIIEKASFLISTSESKNTKILPLAIAAPLFLEKAAPEFFFNLIILQEYFSAIFIDSWLLLS